jgi:hypothetical protein
MSATQQGPGDPPPFSAATTSLADANARKPSSSPNSPNGLNSPNGPNPLGVASLIIGGVALLISVIPLLNYVASIIAIVGIVLGIVAWNLKGRRRLFAVLGTLVSAIAFAAGIALATFYTAGLASLIEGWIRDGR